jgi:NAD(P)-dependent dehydrogenase (short-subunit alcohol dehydrogenase family)
MVDCIGLTPRCASVDLAKDGIRVNACGESGIETNAEEWPSLDNQYATFLNEVLRQHPAASQQPCWTA